MVYGFKSVSNPTGVVPITERQLTAQWNALYFGSEAKFNESYAGWYDIADTVSIVSYSLKTLQQYLAVNYPYAWFPLPQNTPFQPFIDMDTAGRFLEKVIQMLQSTSGPRRLGSGTRLSMVC